MCKYLECNCKDMDFKFCLIFIEFCIYCLVRYYKFVKKFESSFKYNSASVATFLMM